MGFPADVTQQLYKLASISLCSNVSGQIMVRKQTRSGTSTGWACAVTLCNERNCNCHCCAQTGLMVNPPVEGDESFALYNAEKTGILTSLA